MLREPMRLQHGDKMIATKTFSFKSIANFNDYTKLLIHSNTTDGSTTFTDSSDSGHTMFAQGNAQHDTAQYKFPQSSMLFDGNDQIAADSHSDFNLASNSFTLDFWVRFSSFPFSPIFLDIFESSSKRVIFRLDRISNELEILVYNITFSTIIEQSFNPSINTWYHIAYVRDGSLFTIYVNGVSIGSTTATDTFPDISGFIYIGSDLAGWIDELRLVKGKAMWVSNFVPAAGRYE